MITTPLTLASADKVLLLLLLLKMIISSYTDMHQLPLRENYNNTLWNIGMVYWQTLQMYKDGSGDF